MGRRPSRKYIHFNGVYFDGPMNTALEKECARTGESLSGIIRRAVAKHLGMPEPPIFVRHPRRIFTLKSLHKRKVKG